MTGTIHTNIKWRSASHHHPSCRRRLRPTTACAMLPRTLAFGSLCAVITASGQWPHETLVPSSSMSPDLVHAADVVAVSSVVLVDAASFFQVCLLCEYELPSLCTERLCVRALPTTQSTDARSCDEILHEMASFMATTHPPRNPP